MWLYVYYYNMKAYVASCIRILLIKIEYVIS
jgi:hypothetical protein